MIRLCLIFLVSLLSLQASSAQYTGFSSHASLHPDFPCRDFIAVAKNSKLPAMTALWGTFGNSHRCIKLFIKEFADRPHLVEIFFENDTCRRGGRKCYEDEIAPSLSERGYTDALERMPRKIRTALENRAKQIAAIPRLGVSNTRWALAIGLEDKYSSRAALRKTRLIKKFWKWDIVRNPASDHVKIGEEDISELHAEKSRFGALPCIWNQDGLELSPEKLENVFSSYQGCLARFVWTKEAQGIKDYFVAPKQRTFTISEYDKETYGGILRRSSQD